MKTAVKILDLGDCSGGIAPLHFENMGGERFCASLTESEIVYLHARTGAIVLKLKAKEEPVA